LTVLIFSQTRIKTKAKVKGKRTRINKNATEAKRNAKICYPLICDLA
jgi:hypothetical protein